MRSKASRIKEMASCNPLEYFSPCFESGIPSLHGPPKESSDFIKVISQAQPGMRRVGILLSHFLASVYQSHRWTRGELTYKPLEPSCKPTFAATRPMIMPRSPYELKKNILSHSFLSLHTCTSTYARHVKSRIT